MAQLPAIKCISPLCYLSVCFHKSQTSTSMYSLKIMHDAVAFKGTLAVPQIMHAAFIVFASKGGKMKAFESQ